MVIDSRRLAAACAVVALAGCAPLKQGTQQAGHMAAKVGNKVEAGAHSAGQKTRSFWRWLFGPDEETAHKPRPAPTPKPAKLPTYSQQYVGESN